MSPSLRTSALLAALLACIPVAAWSKSSDRNQDMTIESDGQNGDLNDNGVNDEGRNADGIADFSCKDASQVGSVLSLIADFQIVKQFVAHFIGAARDRL